MFQKGIILTKQPKTIVQTFWLFTIITPVLIVISGSLWLKENTLSTVFWDNHPPIIYGLGNIRLLTVMEMIIVAVVLCSLFYIVKIIVNAWKPKPIIYNLCVQFGYIYVIMFIFVFDRVNDSKYTSGGFRNFRFFDLIEPICLTFVLFIISVLGFYIAESKIKGRVGVVE
ncbi:hypothetical protein HX021_11690 [Sphingobacterium sp. N143]|uniref:hypothetical protein n=1 Tax=Sphingobacterium sp. N143 TaxID=2746727 RepID=UPI002575DDD5|nr:hypothetical protein [Sphingobacterium sp. N143]MDM1294943.1 hypothetical protein [Sphingobacterium sp. N143]